VPWRDLANFPGTGMQTQTNGRRLHGGAAGRFGQKPDPAKTSSLDSDTARHVIGQTAMSDPLICEPGGSGLILPLFPGENTWDPSRRAWMYGGMLLWSFLGVAIVADCFMGAIERITSQEKKVSVKVREAPKTYFVRIWNPTVANLTLMALGSSAPEILLSVIELLGNKMYAGDLGPSTIVGSAAFNLLVIIALCVVAVPDGEVRRIDSLGVYACTAVASVGAYVWLVVILQLSSPDLIEVWEGVPPVIGSHLIGTRLLKLRFGARCMQLADREVGA